MAKNISSLAVGAKVKFGKIHGSAIIWKIADKNHSGYPSNSVTLITDQIIKLMCFDAKEPSNTEFASTYYGNARWLYSNIRKWMNSTAAAGKWYSAAHSADAPPSSSNGQTSNPYDTIAGFLYAFSADERAALLSTTNKTTHGSSSENSTDKVFLPSRIELGLTTNTVGGSKLSCFSDATSRKATVTAAAVSNSGHSGSPSSGAYWKYWTRDPYGSVEVGGDYVVGTGGASSYEQAMAGVIGFRPLCNVSSSLKVSDSTDSSGCYTVVFNQAPTAPGSITVPSSIFGGQSAEISWGTSTDADGNLSGYILEQKVDSGSWTQVYKGTARSYSAAITFGWTSVQYRVKAYDSDGDVSGYTTSATRTVTNNRAPAISGSDGALGSFTGTAPSVSYTVTDEDGDTITVIEKLDGTTLRSYTPTLGSANTLTFTADAWQKILNGSHTLTITATDPLGLSVTRTLTFTKAVTSVDFVQTEAMAADDMPTKALVNIQGYFPTGCNLTIWICNNGNDASPTWEDITSKALSGKKHFFTNTTKTASAWGVKIKVQLARGSATETCYITSIGGNFA